MDDRIFKNSAWPTAAAVETESGSLGAGREATRAPESICAFPVSQHLDSKGMFWLYECNVVHLNFCPFCFELVNLDL